MIAARLDRPGDFESWRREARRLLGAAVEPSSVSWQVGARDGLFGDAADDTGDAPAAGATASVPSAFIELAERAVAHRDAQNPALLYRVLWRLTHGEPDLMRRLTDPDVHRLATHAKAVSRDLHKMKAFVRFHEIDDGRGAKIYVAWFEPEHHIVDLVAPFFVRRFAGMRFSIVTPERSMHWDGETLSLGAGAGSAQAAFRSAAGLGASADDVLTATPSQANATTDEMARIWLTYYASIFNPARLNVRMMRQEMPQKYWKNLPEARLIPQLVAEAPDRVEAMARRAPTTPRKRIPSPATGPVRRRDPPVAQAEAEAAPAADAALAIDASIEGLRAQARGCTACPLWEPATQTVFGEGPENARVVFLGEQPGDQEDLAGRPFVGPAGKMLDRALAEVGIDRSAVYLTNTVKHFKFTPRGKTRLHARANAAEQAACRRWLLAELETLQPERIVCLGAMAAQSIFGRKFRLMQERGEWRELSPGRFAFATVHPSYLLRVPDERERAQAYRDFVADLAKVARVISAMRER